MRTETLLGCCVAVALAGTAVGGCGSRTLLKDTGDELPMDGGYSAGTGGLSGIVSPTTGGKTAVGGGGTSTGARSGGTTGGSTSGGGQPACAPPRARCGSACVDLSKNDNHCGGCFNGCASGDSCVAGVCRSPASACLPNEIQCPTWGCIDINTNAFACGSCSTPCRNGEKCVNGECVYGTCLNGGTFCETPYGGQCVTDFSWDWSNCGGCGIQCGDYESCENGRCTQPSCTDYYYCDSPTGACNFVYCEQSGCTDVSTDVTNCGGCGQSCTGTDSLFWWDAYTCRDGVCGCSAIANPCGPTCAVRFSYCPNGVDAGSPLDVCHGTARNAYDRCGCDNCLDQVIACSGSAACINAMDCALQSPCVGCSEPFYSCYDQWGASDPLADALVSCLNRSCANP